MSSNVLAVEDITDPSQWDQYEKRFLQETFSKNKALFSCPSCHVQGTGSNAGKAGSDAQGGVRISSILCVAANGGCGRKLRVAPWLEASNQPGLLATYNRSLEAAKANGLRTTKPSQPAPRQTKFNFEVRKRARNDTTPEPATASTITNQIAPQITTQPTTAAIAPTSAAASFEISMIYARLEALENAQKRIETLENENKQLKAQLAELTATRAAPPPVANTAAPLEQRDINSTNKPTTYANILAKPAPAPITTKNFVKKAAPKLLAQRPEPTQFGKLYVKINDSRPIKKCKTAKEVQSLLEGVLQFLKIRKQVFRCSKIGNSIMEIYFPLENRSYIIDQLIYNQAEILQNFNPAAAPTYGRLRDCTEKTIKRLTHLYRNAHLKNLRECILKEYSPEIQEAVINAALPNDQPETIMAQDDSDMDPAVDVNNNSTTNCANVAEETLC